MKSSTHKMFQIDSEIEPTDMKLFSQKLLNKQKSGWENFWQTFLSNICEPLTKDH